MSRNSKAPFRPYEDKAAFRELKALINSSRPPIVLVGAGASVSSGYPNWSDLLKRMKKAAGGSLAAQWKKNLDHTADAPWTAEVLATDLQEAAFSRFIKREFRQKGRPGEPHLSLAKMPFRHFLTTNFDPCIELALKAAKRKFEVVRWSDTAAVSKFLINLGRQQTPHVVYLHGRYNEPSENIILTESSYVTRYIASDDARRKLMAIFMTHPVLFVGFSMNDPDLANLMREVTARLQSRPPVHFALMGYKDATERETLRSRMETKFGVRPVLFSLKSADNSGDDYSNLQTLLDDLVGLQRKPKAAPVTPQGSRTIGAREFDPEDPNKGRFGRLAEHSGRRLSVHKLRGSRQAGWLNYNLCLEPTAGSKPINGDVLFYMHPTFRNKVYTVPAVNGRANFKDVWSYGAFTVGAVIVKEKRRYELDLAMESGLPLWFRQR